ncbi:MAG: hypothetical protein ABSE47_07405 [Acidimicrobiales bacterium]
MVVTATVVVVEEAVELVVGSVVVALELDEAHPARATAITTAGTRDPAPRRRARPARAGVSGRVGLGADEAAEGRITARA